MITELSVLKSLEQVVTKYVNLVEVAERDKPLTENQTRTFSEEEKNCAAKVIQRIWRGYKIKEFITSNPFFSYLSFLDPQQETKLLLSIIMFGRHIAEITNTTFNYQINNPFISMHSTYHRTDHVITKLMELFCKKQGITLTKDKIYLPISILKNLPIRELMDEAKNVVQKKFPKDSIRLDYQFINDANQQVGVLIFKNDNVGGSLRRFIEGSGFIASPWQIAEAVATTITKDSVSRPAEMSETPLLLDLPTNKSELLKSKLFSKLIITSFKEKYPTHLLAKALFKLIKNLPEELDSRTIQRIALMLDLANTFYAFNYERYAFFVSVIMHELSVELAVSKQEEVTLETNFNAFSNVSQHVFQQALGLSQNELNAVYTISFPALSGTNAFYLAQELAKNMIVAQDHSTASAKFEYYEIKYLISNTNFDTANIMLLSPGPIVSNKGLHPGTDINKFVEKHIIEPQRKDAITLLIDTTSALNKDLALSDTVKQLIQEGQLSIIIFESFQKFGLLHTDQAQVGRVVAFCSKKHYLQKNLDQWIANAKSDFATHPLCQASCHS
jgi:hypothetical protein